MSSTHSEVHKQICRTSNSNNMTKSMWIRCPECGRWCEAEEMNALGRLHRSVTKGDQQIGDYCGELGDEIGMKGLGKTIGRVINAGSDIMKLKHLGEAINGDKYRFYCECGNAFGTNDEKDDRTKEHELWCKAITLSEKCSTVKNQAEQKNDFAREVEDTLAEIENSEGIDDAKAILHDVLACCYYFLFNDSSKAMLEINKSLELFDYDKTHVHKGLFMGEVVSPVDCLALKKVDS